MDDDLSIDFGFHSTDNTSTHLVPVPLLEESIPTFDDFDQWFHISSSPPGPTTPPAPVPPTASPLIVGGVSTLATLPSTTMEPQVNDSHPTLDVAVTSMPPVPTPRNTTAPRVRVAGRSIAETQAWKSKTLTFRANSASRGVSKRYAKPTRGFLYNTDKRSKAHSAQVLRIMELIKKLDKETAPFLFFYCSRPESVRFPQGGNHSHFSPALEDALGEGEAKKILKEIHSKCRKSVERALEEVKESIHINRQVNQARQVYNEAARILEAAKGMMGDCAPSDETQQLCAQIDLLAHEMSIAM